MKKKWSYKIIPLNSEKNLKKAEWYKSRNYKVEHYGFGNVIVYNKE